MRTGIGNGAEQRHNLYASKIVIQSLLILIVIAGCGQRFRGAKVPLAAAEQQSGKEDNPEQGLQMANRFIEMLDAADGNPDKELVWAEDVRRMFAEYCTKNSCTEEQAWKDFMAGIDFLSCGTQPEINRYCLITASLEYFRALEANKALINDVKDGRLKELLMEEYRAWSAMNEYQQSAFVSIRMAGQHYSALPMDYEANFAAQATLRKDNLDTERGILLEGKPYERQHEDVDRQVIRGLDESVTKWLASRRAITRYMPEPKATYYDNMTADYCWEIVN